MSVSLYRFLMIFGRRDVVPTFDSDHYGSPTTADDSLLSPPLGCSVCVSVGTVVKRLKELRVPTGLVSNADDRIREPSFYCLVR